MEINELVRKECLRRNYSPKTIQTYNHCLNRFFRICRKEPKSVNKVDIQNYLDGMVEKQASSSTLNVHLSALKFFYEQILRKRLTLKLRFAKRAKRLPECLTKEETARFFNEIKNEKHNLMMRFFYSAGLRVSELVNLRVKDLQLEEGYGWVRQGKGKKDRQFVISKKLTPELKGWIEQNTLAPYEFLFSSCRQKKLSVSTIQQIVKKSSRTARIHKRVHPHTLRHSFATHFIENGNRVTTLQRLLGHSRIETTMVYVHTAFQNKVDAESPYDRL
ncbi:MAG: site-specific tyrosine recombinase/integron integrase [Candidatus Woesearchaeota archaeon]